MQAASPLKAGLAAECADHMFTICHAVYLYFKILTEVVLPVL